jgi:hypothetical protein
MCKSGSEDFLLMALWALALSQDSCVMIVLICADPHSIHVSEKAGATSHTADSCHMKEGGSEGHDRSFVWMVYRTAREPTSESHPSIL